MVVRIFGLWAAATAISAAAGLMIPQTCAWSILGIWCGFAASAAICARLEDTKRRAGEAVSS